MNNSPPIQSFGTNLDPNRSHRIHGKFEGTRQHSRLTMNPSTIAPGQTLQVRLPTLADDEVIVPATAKVAFDLNVKDGVPVINIARSIVSRTEVAVDGNVILSIDNASILCNFMDE